MSSPGLARLAAISSAIAPRQPASTAWACSGETVVSTIMSMTDAVLARASSDMPIRSATSRAGNGYAYRSRRSTTSPGGVAAIASRSWLVSSTTRGRMASVRRGLNALPTSRRRRTWSFPYAVTMLSMAIQLIISQSGGISPLMNAGQWLRALFVTRGSVSTRLIVA